MAIGITGDDFTRARIDLLLSRLHYILLLGAVVYPLFFILDWKERPWDRAAALVVRVTVALIIIALAWFSRTALGREYALWTGSMGFLIAQAGFTVIIWHAKGLGTSTGDDFEIFFGTYCLLVPAGTWFSACVGIAMLALHFVTYVLSGVPVHFAEIAWNAFPFFVIFLTGRHVANLVEVAWRSEFVRRAHLEDAINQLHEVQDKLVQSEKMAALGRLTAGVAHELKNPLFVIGTNLSLIQDGIEALGQTKCPDSAIKKFSEGTRRVRSALGRATAVSELLRQFSSPPTRRDVLSNLNAVIEMSISLVDMARKKEITIHRDFQNLPPYPCDSQSISQVFVNLLENACDAIDERGNVWVASTVKPDRSVVVSVSDDGCGIPPEYVSRLTEPFFTTKEPGKGMGLGLAVATSIVQRYGGELSFLPRNPGTTAVVTLPSKSQASSSD